MLRYQYNTKFIKGLTSLVLLFTTFLCYSQDVVLENQADVDAFDPSTTIINGDLSISPPDNIPVGDIDDLSNLSNLITVNGDLTIERNSKLTSLLGLNNLSYVQGDIEINNNAKVANLNGLTELDSVGGDFIIAEMSALTEINNLNQLISVEGDLEIDDCNALLEIAGFSDLQYVVGRLAILRNDNLISIDGFNAIVQVVDNLTFFFNLALTNIEGFENLELVGERFEFKSNRAIEIFSSFNNLREIGNTLLFIGNDAMLEINSFESLESIGHDLNITDNSKLTDISDMPYLDTIGASLLIYQNDDLVNIGSFDALVAVESQFIINENKSIESLSGFNNLKEVGQSFFIQSNNSLNKIDGFQKLETIAYDLTIEYLPVLQDFTGLNLLNSVGREFLLSNLEVLENLDNFSSLNSIVTNLIIQNNESLQNINGLSNLIYIGENISLLSNNSLENIDGFLSVVQITGVLNIYENDQLKNLDGLQNLVSFNGDLSVYGNSGLEQIDGLSKVTSIQGSIDIYNNESLDNLNGLSNLLSVGKYLNISSNNSLTTLDGLENIRLIEGDIKVSLNDQLTDCCAIQSLISENDAVEGIIDISNNPSECSSSDEVRDAFCGMKIKVNTNPPCMNGDNGSIQVHVTAYDTIPFSYHWIRKEDGSEGMGTSYEDLFLIKNLTQGTYDLTITNPRPDEESRSNIILTELDGTVFEIIEISSTNSSNQFSNGSIHLKISGGIPPFDINWDGPEFGSQIGLTVDTFDIPSIPHGTYDITITDSIMTVLEVSILLLDETIPIFPCQEPLDIVILNDMSGSVNAVEYKESKEFFLNFLNEVNIGFGADESRASIVEWSSNDDQKIVVPMTGSYDELNEYINAPRSFTGGTSPNSAMVFGYELLEDVARDNVEKVLILSTDGAGGQVSNSLIAQADQYKAQGYHILTIAFDQAFSHSITRKKLQNVASLNALAPGAPAYSQLDEDLAIDIVNLYLCPLDPGSSATVYFNRDGDIEILDLIPEKNCPYPEFVEINFEVGASRELSIPSGTPVTFYLNDPTQFGATKVLTWQIPCTIPVGSSQTYNVAIPISGPSKIFAVLNDDGIEGAPIKFPITDLEEIAYSNNIDQDEICVGVEASLQALKYATTPIPACDTMVNYSINVCNISNADAFDVTITDEYPDGFELIGVVVNTNNCATDNGSSFDIPVNCCVSLNLSYDASQASHAFYNDQDVILDGPSNQTYYNFDGADSNEEDVAIDGSIDCPSSIIEFTKEVNFDESCDDAFLTYTFTINNELNIPLQGLTFTDIVPAPSSWAFQPYFVEGLSIGSLHIENNEARFTINEVYANTVARFSMDLGIGKFSSDGQIINTATIDNIPDLENGGFKTLTSNSTTTQITASPEITLPDTIIFQLTSDTIQLQALLNGPGDVHWTSVGDGIFLSEHDLNTAYILGSQDKVDQIVSLFFSVETDCSETGKQVIVLLQECELFVDEITVGDCFDNGTSQDNTDDTYQVSFNIIAQNPGNAAQYFCIIENDTLGPYPYASIQSVTLDADGVSNLLTFMDSQFESCILEEEVNQQSCSDECQLILDTYIVGDCNNNGTPFDNTDDTYELTFSLSAFNSGVTYFLIADNDTIGTYNYDEEYTIELTANSSDDIIYFVDSENENCQLSEMENVESCSDQCVVNLESFLVSECDDNDTPFDNTDDTFTITIQVAAYNPGMDSTFYIVVDSDTLGLYPYNSEQVIILPANGIDHMIDILDSQIDDCIISELVNMESCSDECNLSLITLETSECDDNGTPYDDSDDTFVVTFNLTASNPGLDSSFMVLNDNDTLGIYAFDMDHLVTLSANGIDQLLSFIDSQNEDCLLLENVNVESCSDECTPDLDVVLVSECDDNDTPNNNTDDTFMVTYIMSAVNPGSDSTYWVIIDNDTLGIYPYDTDQQITLPADGNEIIIQMVDSEKQDCALTTSFEEESCSDECILNLESFSVSECNDNGTSDINSDDTYDITFNLSATNQGPDSRYLMTIGNDSFGPFQYNTEQVITLAANELEVEINFRDSEYENCLITETVNLESCSIPCGLNLDFFDISECDDNVTPNDKTDDSYQITFNISSAQETDSFYRVIMNNAAYGEYSFGADHSMILPADGLEKEIRFEHADQDNCLLSEFVTLEDCSEEELIPDDIVIPNVFSPNNDRNNDNWTIELNNSSEIISCAIYDRWGNLIYTTENGEVPFWDGTFKGKDVNQGVYVFKIIYLNTFGESILKFGDITLVK